MTGQQGLRETRVCDISTPAPPVPTAVAPSPRIPVVRLLAHGTAHSNLPVRSGQPARPDKSVLWYQVGFKPWRYQLLLTRAWARNLLSLSLNFLSCKWRKSQSSLCWLIIICHYCEYDICPVYSGSPGPRWMNYRPTGSGKGRESRSCIYGRPCRRQGLDSPTARGRKAGGWICPMSWGFKKSRPQKAAELQTMLIPGLRFFAQPRKVLIKTTPI